MPPASTPPEQPFEKSLYDVRDELHKLKLQVENKIDGEEEDARNTRILNVSNPALVAAVGAFLEEVKAKNDTDPAFAAENEDIINLVEALIGDKKFGEAANLNKILSGLTEGVITDSNLLHSMDAVLLEDEMNLLLEHRSSYEKIHDRLGGLYLGFPSSKAREALSFFGITDANSFSEVIIDRGLQLLESIPKIGSFAKHWRVQQALHKVNKEDMSHDAIETVWDTWNTDYDSYLSSTDENKQPPSLYEYAKEESKFIKLKEEFDTAITGGLDLFGGGETIELQKSGEPHAVDEGGWKIKLPMDCIEKDGANFKLIEKGEKLKELFAVVKPAIVPPIAFSEVHLGPLKREVNKITATIDADMKDVRLEAVINLIPNGFENISLYTDANLVATEPLARYESGKLMLNWQTIDTPAAMAAIVAKATAAASAGPTRVNWKWNQPAALNDWSPV